MSIEDGLTIEPKRQPAPGSSVDDEIRGYAHPSDRRKPNSLYLQLGQLTYISWHSDSGTAVLSLIVLIVISIIVIILLIIGMSITNREWLTQILQILGQIMLTVAGAIVGASASNRSGNGK
jgi:hypothetical protein